MDTQKGSIIIRQVYERIIICIRLIEMRNFLVERTNTLIKLRMCIMSANEASVVNVTNQFSCTNLENYFNILGHVF